MRSLKNILIIGFLVSVINVVFALHGGTAYYCANGVTLSITTPHDCNLAEDLVICTVGMVVTSSLFASQPLYATPDACLKQGEVPPVHTANLLYRWY